ncbi:unnamed protein product [Trifolium pratense]|uniref:Uncharacterized protein n=1 Tax=Trifolium pratense TaxID=57577 RepID=A0ACB0JRV4_TRIPR|nr:unnamed protein product [Trifolium pratense]
MLVPQAKILCLGRKCLCLRRNSHLLTPVIKGKRRSEIGDRKIALETSILRTFEDQGAWRQGFEGGNTSRSSCNHAFFHFFDCNVFYYYV